MSLPRVIACLDVDGERVVKGTSFVALRDVGEPALLAAAYERAGADEVVLLDITASAEQRPSRWSVVTRTAETLFVPLVFGGGIRSLADARAALRAGADKVALNSAAVADPDLIARCAEALGAQCVVVSIDVRRTPAGPRVVTHGGRRPTALEPVAWAQAAVARGAGEILLTSIDADGQRSGYDLELTAAVAAAVPVPVVASGGAGCAQHVVDVLARGRADAALLARAMQDGSLSLGAFQHALRAAGLRVRDADVAPASWAFARAGGGGA
ncbi:MAG: imidazole glycerol phosphate synthase subunit HisF [Planctomycetota bacterium]